MTGFRATIAGAVSAALSVLLSAVPALGATAIPTLRAVGTYRVYVTWQHVGSRRFTIVLRKHGVGSVDGKAGAIEYTRTKRAFQMTITTGASAATFDGITTTAGLNTANHPGATTNAAGDRGTWYAVTAN